MPHNRNYFNAHKLYPKNWKTEIVPAVKERANDCCEWCSLKNGQLVYSVKMKLKHEDGEIYG